MSLGSLLPIGGAALGAIASGFASGVVRGGFASLLAEPQGSHSATQSGSSTKAEAVDLREAIPEFVQQLREAAASQGISLPQDLSLHSDGEGRVFVESNHPQRAELEALIESSPELRSSFDQIEQAATNERRRVAFAGGSSFGEFRLAIRGDVGLAGFE